MYVSIVLGVLFCIPEQLEVSPCEPVEHRAVNGVDRQALVGISFRRTTIEANVITRVMGSVMPTNFDLFVQDLDPTRILCLLRLESSTFQ